MKILVTGGCGFIGSNFIRYLEEIRYEGKVVIIDKLGIGANISNLNNLKLNYKFIKLDLAKKNIPRIRDYDYIVNFAAETHVDRSILKPYDFYKNNLDSIFKILESLRKSKQDVRMVHVSTDEVYGDILNGSFTENSPLTPSNPYSATKAAQDMLVLAYYRTYGLNISITRSANNYGPYQHPEKLIPKTIIRALYNKKVPIYGLGTQVRSWIHAKDNAAAIYFVLKKGMKGDIYNIPGSAEVENLNLVKMILKLLNKSEKLITFVENRPGHDVRYSMNGEKIKELGWKHKIDITTGLRDTVKWYIKNRWYWKTLVNDSILGETPWKEKH